MSTAKRKNNDDEDWIDTTQKKTIKKNANETCIICLKDTTESLSSLNSLESWKTLLHAAEVREHQGIISVSSTLKPGEVPQVKHHRTCRSVFTLKRDLEKIKEKEVQVFKFTNFIHFYMQILFQVYFFHSMVLYISILQFVHRVIGLFSILIHLDENDPEIAKIE